MREFSDKIEQATQAELADGTPASILITVLINMIARITVGVHRKTGANLDALVEIVRHQIDEAVVFHHRPPKPREMA